jgi:methyl-accepting chemotaxis protein
MEIYGPDSLTCTYPTNYFIMRLSDLNIATRLYLGFGAVVALLVLLVSLAYTNFGRLGNANDMNIHTYEVVDEVEGALTALVNIETGQRGFALTGKEASLEPYNSGKQAFLTHLAAARKLTSDNPRQQERLQRLGDEQQKWLASAIDATIKLRREGSDAEMAAVVGAEQAGKGKQSMDAMRKLVADIEAEEAALMAQRKESVVQMQEHMAQTLIGGGILAAVLAVVIAVWQARNITTPLRAAVAVAQRVATGDLTARVEASSKDEIGQLMKALGDMNEALRDIVGRVRSGTDTIATASGEINSGNQDLSSRTEQQASSLEETASSMEELTSTVKQNADNARQANQLAASASATAVRGGEVVAQVVNTMGSINESAHRIADIITVIDGIAFQTNILALNAAVEAARAGEQGRGFAVVAGEVRNLAQRSAAAAKEIKDLIGDSVEKVEAGSRLVDQAGSTMDEVVGSVKRVSDIISEIAAASDEQRAGIEQVNGAITQMDQVTQQNAALVEEAAAAAESMQEQAHALAQLVATFQTGQERPAAAAPSRTPVPPRAASPAPARLTERVPARVPASSRRETVAATDGWDSF